MDIMLQIATRMLVPSSSNSAPMQIKEAHGDADDQAN
jgi:hypothetical protein